MNKRPCVFHRDGPDWEWLFRSVPGVTEAMVTAVPQAFVNPICSSLVPATTMALAAISVQPTTMNAISKDSLSIIALMLSIDEMAQLHSVSRFFRDVVEYSLPLVRLCRIDNVTCSRKKWHQWTIRAVTNHCPRIRHISFYFGSEVHIAAEILAGLYYVRRFTFEGSLDPIPAMTLSFISVHVQLYGLRFLNQVNRTSFSHSSRKI